MHPLQIADFHSGIDDRNFIFLQTFFDFLEHLFPQASFAGFFRVYPLKGPRQGDPLPVHFAHLATDPKNDRWQGPLGGRMVMLARTMLQRWPPEGGDLHRDGSIAFVTMALWELA